MAPEPEFFFTIHDQTGKRVDDTSDDHWSEAAVNSYVGCRDKVIVDGREFTVNDDGRLLSVQVVVW